MQFYRISVSFLMLLLIEKNAPKGGVFARFIALGVLNSFCPGVENLRIKKVAQGFCPGGGMVRLGID